MFIVKAICERSFTFFRAPPRENFSRKNKKEKTLAYAGNIGRLEPRMKDTRTKILETTFLLLLKKGYDAVSVSDIQKKLGMSRGLLYRYFKNKSDLIIAACAQYFFDGYLNTIDLENISLKDFIAHIIEVENSLSQCGRHKVDILKYNTLYSAVIMREPRFQAFALGEFAKAIVVVRNAKKRGEIKGSIPDNFVGATLLSILGRTTYITYTPTDDYVRRRIREDLERFYALIKK